MKLNKTLLRVAENAIKGKQDSVALNKSWQLLHQEYGIGLTQGTKLKLDQRDRAKLLDIIQLETGINLQQTSVTEFANLTREQALKVALDEKMAGQKVKQQRLAIKVLAGQSLRINQQHYRLPVEGHMDMSLEQIETIEHNCLLIVENYRCFDHIQQIKISLPEKYQQPFVVYRGDEYYSQQTLRLLLQKTALPVIAMMDIDPEGLLIACSFERVLGLMCVRLSELDSLLEEKGNAQLYAKQLPRCQQALNSAEEPVIKALWAVLRQHQKGWVQEHDLGAGYEVGFMGFGG
ncbi:MAG: hypothetical protein KAJ63_07475 [Methyloprofundus sp.]|nr:hypothetical protein [Methyloprofundus sp.]